MHKRNQLTDYESRRLVSKEERGGVGVIKDTRLRDTPCYV